jgi:DNA polymerase I-like protein with 3'-5' exonuclease and polymerase domains
MIYLVTNSQTLFKSDLYEVISVEKALDILDSKELWQLDTETNGRNCHICKLLCVQFGNKSIDTQIVVDCETIDIKLFKSILESKFFVLQNAKFDLQFFYSIGIIPRRVYDTMIVEQLIYLGYPTKKEDPYNGISYSLKDIADRRLGVEIDKSVRGEITWRGLDDVVIEYAANDVVYLEDIMHSQMQECKEKGLVIAAKLECEFTPAIAYLEWCGIKLDEKKWKAKMWNDTLEKEKAQKELEAFIIECSEKGYKKIPADSFKKYVYVNLQGSLFDGFDTTPKVNINWSSPKQVIELAKLLGFNTVTQDKKSGEDKDSVVEKLLGKQKTVCPEFLKHYFNFKEHEKVCATYGQSYLDAINPITGRIHSQFRAIGTKSGRMACGSNSQDTDLAKLKGIKDKKRCVYVQLQNLPADDATRGAFVPEDGNLMCSCDFSALESRLGADIYNEQAMLDEFLHGGGDMHSLCAKMVFSKELEGIEVKDVKHERPDLRKKVKSVEFAKQFD